MFNFLPLYTIGLINNDAPEAWGIGFQDSASPTHEGITELHDSIFFYLVIICFGVLWVLSSTIINFHSNKSQLVYKYANHGTLIELIWTITPALVLIAIAFPSFKLLYLMDEVISPSITIKVVGHQWYWSVEYSDFINEDGESIEFDSYMIPESDLEDGQLRLLEVDNRIVVPVDTHIRFITTGADVIHDFAVPSLGLKIDSIPGRLNSVSVLIEREGVFYGQCSEICGVYHSMMPIAIEAVSPDKYLSWIDDQASSSPPLLDEAECSLESIIAGPPISTGQASASNNSSDYIQWADTKGMQACRKVLRQMFNHFSEDHVLKMFMLDNLMHTLEEPTGHTGILTSDVTTDSLNNNSTTRFAHSER